MKVQKTSVLTGAVTGVLVLAWALAGCGGSSSSSASAAGDAPTDATQRAFCGSFTKLSKHSTPSEIADQLATVGTPLDMDASARHGFELFVDKVGALPDDDASGALDDLQRSLSRQDETDLLAFLTYTRTACAHVPRS